MSAPSSVDEYIAAASEAAQPMLKELRESIRAAAPQADERISYGMPSYHLQGRLAYFQAHARHIGLYSFNLEDARGVGLEGYMSAKSTLHFPLNQPLPRAAIQKLVQQRVRANDTKGPEKAARKG
ncbi:MAG: DUF1801 domain-containing protein [Candidatus Dormiibacterota bacterium]